MSQKSKFLSDKLDVYRKREIISILKCALEDLCNPEDDLSSVDGAQLWSLSSNLKASPSLDIGVSRRYRSLEPPS